MQVYSTIFSAQGVGLLLEKKRKKDKILATKHAVDKMSELAYTKAQN